MANGVNDSSTDPRTGRASAAQHRGCRTAREAITTAPNGPRTVRHAWIKLEVIANDDTLQPTCFGLVEAAEVLAKDGFEVFPYTTEDLGVADRLLEAGCQVLMPWGAPIGTGRASPTLMRSKPCAPISRHPPRHRRRHRRAEPCGASHGKWLRRLPPQHSGRQGGRSRDMAEAFAKAIEAGRSAIRIRADGTARHGKPSTPVAGTPFFDLTRKP